MKKNDSSRELRLERLEERWTPAAVLLSGLELRLVGDSAHNSAEVHQTGTSIVATINGTNGTVSRAFPSSQVRSVAFYGGAGNDRFVNNLANVPSKAWGGVGNDYLEGYNAADVFYGEAGNDTLIGYGGNDYLDGGTGKDYLRGGAGDDYLVGGLEPNIVDTLIGDQGMDVYRNGFDFNRPIIDGTQASDIEQGEIGSCSTLSTMAQLASRGYDFASQIQRVAANTYRVVLRGMGTQSVTFDGSWNDQDAEPRAIGSYREFWTILVQRARMQAYGIDISRFNVSDSQVWNNLNNQTGGRLCDPASVIQDITGRQANGYFLNQLANNPAGVAQVLSRGYTVIAGSWNSSQGDSVFDANGVAGSHAYAVVNVWFSGGQWLVRLYNPWGLDNPNGSLPDILSASNDGFITMTWASFTRSGSFSSLFIG